MAHIPKEELEELYWNKKLSYSDIAKIYEYKSTCAIRKLFYKYGIPRRKGKDALINASEKLKHTWFKKGHKTWNTGINISDKHKKKISDSCKGRPSSFKGKHHTEENKERMSKLRTIHGGSQSSYQRRAYKQYGKKCLICKFDIIVEVHHITKQCDDGTHGIENLIVLCPNHHAMADKKIITEEQLKAIIKPHN